QDSDRFVIACERRPGIRAPEVISHVPRGYGVVIPDLVVIRVQRHQPPADQQTLPLEVYSLVGLLQAWSRDVGDTARDVPESISDVQLGSVVIGIIRGHLFQYRQSFAIRLGAAADIAACVAESTIGIQCVRQPMPRSERIVM